MSFIRAAIVTAMLSAITPAAAVDHVIGINGGVFCRDASQIEGAILALSSGQAIRGTHVSSCFALPPRITIDIESQATVEGVQRGAATVYAPTGERVVGVFASSIDAQFKATPRPSPRSFKSVSPTDVRATPAKWVARDLEFSNVRVYWVDDDDVRFLTNASLTVFASAVRGDARLVAALKSGCETAKESDLARCRVAIRFSYQRHGEDKPNGYLSRTVIETDDVEVIQKRR